MLLLLVLLLAAGELELLTVVRQAETAELVLRRRVGRGDRRRGRRRRRG